MKVELGKDSIALIYINSNRDGKRAIRKELGEQFSEILPVTKRITSFEEARGELGGGHETVRLHDDISWKLQDNSDILAYLKLRVITAALNEGWTHDSTKEEQLWYPKFRHYLPVEVATEEEDAQAGMLTLNDKNGMPHGFKAAGAIGITNSSTTTMPASLAFKSEELATYAGETFTKLYADYSGFFTNE